jgi:hypothetical protein
MKQVALIGFILGLLNDAVWIELACAEWMGLMRKVAAVAVLRFTVPATEENHEKCRSKQPISRAQIRIRTFRDTSTNQECVFGSVNYVEQ